MFPEPPSKMDIDPLRYRPLPKNKPAYGDDKVRYGFIYTTYLVLWKIFVRPLKEECYGCSIKVIKENYINLWISLITLILPKLKIKHTQSYYDSIKQDAEWEAKNDAWVEKHVESMHKDYGRNYNK